jgi:hypothetical protein
VGYSYRESVCWTGKNEALKFEQSHKKFKKFTKLREKVAKSQKPRESRKSDTKLREKVAKSQKPRESRKSDTKSHEKQRRSVPEVAKVTRSRTKSSADRCPKSQKFTISSKLHDLRQSTFSGFRRTNFTFSAEQTLRFPPNSRKKNSLRCRQVHAQAESAPVSGLKTESGATLCRFVPFWANLVFLVFFVPLCAGLVFFVPLWFFLCHFVPVWVTLG